MATHKIELTTEELEFVLRSVSLAAAEISENTEAIVMCLVRLTYPDMLDTYNNTLSDKLLTLAQDIGLHVEKI